MKEELLKIARYNLWANSRACDFLQRLTEEQINKEIQSSFPSVKQTLYHTWGAQGLWLQRLHGYSPSFLPDKDFTGSFKEATDALLHTSEELIEFVESANEDLLGSAFTYHTIDGKEFKSNISDVIRHIVNHSTFHRGQLITLLRQLGYTRLFPTDYIAWCRG